MFFLSLPECVCFIRTLVTTAQGRCVGGRSGESERGISKNIGDRHLPIHREQQRRGTTINKTNGVVGRERNGSTRRNECLKKQQKLGSSQSTEIEKKKKMKEVIHLSI